MITLELAEAMPFSLDCALLFVTILPLDILGRLP